METNPLGIKVPFIQSIFIRSLPPKRCPCSRTLIVASNSVLKFINRFSMIWSIYNSRIMEACAMPQQQSETQTHTVYHRDGSIWARGQKQDGVQDGYWEWFRKDGTIMRSGTFRDGKQVGEWTTYDREGKVHKVTRMKPEIK
jgi:hypothetical protein